MSVSEKRFNREQTFRLVLSSVLVALTVIITFTFPRIQIGPWSGTLAFHVPVLVAMFIHPLAATAVTAASAVAFLFINPIIALRAGSHIVFLLVGYLLLRLGVNAYLTLILIAPIHAAMECLVVWLFVPDASFEIIFIATGLYTIIHHFIDCVIAVAVLKALQYSRVIRLVGFKYKAEH